MYNRTETNQLSMTEQKGQARLRKMFSTHLIGFAYFANSAPQIIDQSVLKRFQYTGLAIDLGKLAQIKSRFIAQLW